MAQRFVDNALRIVRPGGVIAIVGSAPGFGAGELTEILGWDFAAEVDRLMREVLGFEYVDRPVEVNCGSVEAAVDTYGFIYGQKVIDYLVANQQSVLHGMLRIHYRRVEI